MDVNQWEEFYTAGCIIIFHSFEKQFDIFFANHLNSFTLCKSAIILPLGINLTTCICLLHDMYEFYSRLVHQGEKEKYSMARASYLAQWQVRSPEFDSKY